ncbi:DUF3102 domain-containing protein [Azospirillum melinis]
MAPTARSLGNARLSMLAKPRTLTTRAEFAADIRREWTNALEATVAVGRRLNEAKEALPHGEYEAMVTNDLPFSTSTARKLREIAAFVDEGKVPLDRLPEAMGTLYTIATLPEETRQQALDAGTIHPEVTRAEVTALKDRLASQKVEASAKRKGQSLLHDHDLKAPLPGTPESIDETVLVLPVPVQTLTPFDPEAAVVNRRDNRRISSVGNNTEFERNSENVNESSVVDMLSVPWFVNAQDAGAIMVETKSGNRITLAVVVPNEPDVANVVLHIIQLHNVNLRH